MLKHLQIRNFAIVPTLDLEVRDGFTAITGETGAGKSILVDALGLLLGERSDATWVRSGTERAELTAEFSVEHNQEARKWLDEADLSSDDFCVLRRTIHNSGRSRAFINGSPVTVNQIQSLGHLLVEIHGQNEHLRLTKTTEQFNLLDRSGDYTAEIAAVKSAYENWRRLSGELEDLVQQSSLSDGEMELLNFQLEELQQYDITPKAVNKLQIEHDRLAAGGSLLEALTDSIESLDPDSADGQAGLNSDLYKVLGQLQKFTVLDTDIQDACQMLQEAAVNCREATSSLRNARERVDLDPARFAEMATRLGFLHDQARKHRVPMEGLEEIRDKLKTRIELAVNSEQRHRKLLAELQTQLDHYRSEAKNLHLLRQQHALELSERVMVLMAELGMAGGIFELAVSLNPQAIPSARGDDDVQINISTNPGLPPGPLNKIASGGELSRISLAIKVAAARGDESITQIFDEVDAGIGGDTANTVGRLMKRLSSKRLSGNGQALCVTHLAQVAVCAAHQLQVRKASDEDSTQVDTRELDRKNRIDEIARMLSGKISEQSRAHATELLDSADTMM